MKSIGSVAAEKMIGNLSANQKPELMAKSLNRDVMLIRSEDPLDEPLVSI